MEEALFPSKGELTGELPLQASGCGGRARGFVLRLNALDGRFFRFDASGTYCDAGDGNGIEPEALHALSELDLFKSTSSERLT